MQKETFTGEVNGKQFFSRKEMEEYISQCIKNNKPITSISYKNEIRYDNSDTHTTAQCESDQVCTELKKRIKPCIQTLINNLSWPGKNESYDTVYKYIVPFVIEDCITDDPSHNKTMIDDCHKKLIQRMEWMEYNIFQNIEDYNIDSAIDFLNEISHKMTQKENWCKTRMQNLKSIINACKEPGIFEELNRDIINITKLKDLIDIYDEVGGYCASMVDIISEKIDRLSKQNFVDRIF